MRPWRARSSIAARSRRSWTSRRASWPAASLGALLRKELIRQERDGVRGRGRLPLPARADQERRVRRPAQAGPGRAARAVCGLARRRHRATARRRWRRCSATTSSRRSGTARRSRASTSTGSSPGGARRPAARIRRAPGGGPRRCSGGCQPPRARRARCCRRTRRSGSSFGSSSPTRCTRPAISTAWASCWRARWRRPSRQGTRALEARARLELACLRPHVDPDSAALDDMLQAAEHAAEVFERIGDDAGSRGRCGASQTPTGCAAASSRASRCSSARSSTPSARVTSASCRRSARR